MPAGTGKGSIGGSDPAKPRVWLQATTRPKRGNEYPLAGVHAEAADPGEGGKVLRVVPAGICHRTAAGRADGPAMGGPEFDYGRTANQQAGGGHRLGGGGHRAENKGGGTHPAPTAQSVRGVQRVPEKECFQMAVSVTKEGGFASAPIGGAPAAAQAVGPRGL